MISGVHAVIYSAQAEKLRAFFKDVLEWPFVDAGGGRLFFAVPPTELGTHEATKSSHELYLMCDDIHATVEKLKAKGVAMKSPVTDRGWGLLTEIELPDGSGMGLYEPKHARPPGR